MDVWRKREKGRVLDRLNLEFRPICGVPPSPSIEHSALPNNATCNSMPNFVAIEQTIFSAPPAPLLPGIVRFWIVK